MRKIGALAACGLLLCVAGCSNLPSVGNSAGAFGGAGAIQVDIPDSPATAPLLLAGRPIVLAVAAVGDARPGASGRKLGRINATVRGMTGTELLLDRDAALVLGDAVRKRLANDGFRLAAAGEAADFRLAGTMRAFRLDILGSDELEIVMEASLRDGAGSVVWSGVVTEKSDRYAGVMGNSRDTIVEYLGEGLASFSGKLGAAVRDSLMRAHPQTVAVGPARLDATLPGVKTMHEPVVREPAAAPRLELAPPRQETAPPPAAAAGRMGRIAVQTQPARAKVYVNDVYYGLSPLNIELPTGIGAVSIRLDGHKTISEKVSVRPGETTEFEARLEK